MATTDANPPLPEFRDDYVLQQVDAELSAHGLPGPGVEQGDFALATPGVIAIHAGAFADARTVARDLIEVHSGGLRAMGRVIEGGGFPGVWQRMIALSG